MDKLEKYCKIIQELIIKHSQYKIKDKRIKTQSIFETERNYYQILEIGGEGYDRIFNCVIHLDLQNEKIWIKRNITDILIAEELVDKGVSSADIILGLQAPYKRPFTQYGLDS